MRTPIFPHSLSRAPFSQLVVTLALSLSVYGGDIPAEAANKTGTTHVTMQGQGWFFAKCVEVEMLHGPAHAPWVRPSEIKSRIRTSASVNVGIIDTSPMGTMAREMERIRKSGPAPRVLPAGLPGVQLRLRLTNHGSEPAIIEVLDFNSTLGNFVVRPAKCTVPAGGSIEVEPMSSQLEGAAAEIPVTVRLRMRGATERQVLTLMTVPPEPPANDTPANSPSP